MDNLEAILLAAGKGTRLKPFTSYTSKHLLPIHNVPMIFYPLKNLQLIGVKKVFIVINEEHLIQWDSLLNHYNFEMNIEIVIQEGARGIPDAINTCKGKIGGENFIVALGDNVIIASNFLNNFKKNITPGKATICGFSVSDPKSFGVAKLNKDNQIVEVLEKPKSPPSNIIIGGFYNFPKNAFSIIANLEYSERGELEIADLINYYIDGGVCNFVISSSQSDYWIDTGDIESLVKATGFVRDLKRNSGLQIAQFNSKE